MRTWRISSALALAALLVPLALLDSASADATAAKPPERHTQADTPPAPLRVLLDSPLRLSTAIRHQAATRPTTSAPAPHKASIPRKRQQPAARPLPRPTATAVVTHTSRSSARTALTKAAPTLAGARSYARSRLSAAQYSCLSSIVRRESGWNPYARNASSGAYGLFQALPGSKMASAGSDWRTNPLTQMRWGISYMKGRYGSPCGAWNFWQKNRWY